MRTLLRLAASAFILLLIAGTAIYAHPLFLADQYLRIRLFSYGAHSRYVAIDGHRVHYYEAGPANGTPLVLVHGLGSRAEDWSPLIPGLAGNGFHIFVPDLLGYGRSDKPDVDYSMTLQETIVTRFMQAVGLPKADVAGWSMGGWVAAKLTVDHPEMVDRLVLYDSAGLYFPATFDASLFTPNDRPGLQHLIQMLQPFHSPTPAFVDRDIIKRLQQNAWVIRRSLDAMTSGRDLLDFRLASIDRPTLIVWGTKDVLIPPSVGESMHHLIRNSSMTQIDGCGHLAPAQCSASALATTLQFLKSDPPLKNQEQTLPGN